MKKAAWVLLSLLTFALAVTAAPVVAQDTYPSSPIRLISGFEVGGGSDSIARLLAQKLSIQMSASVIVENKPGANGNIAADYVSKSKPNGYTLLFTTPNQILSPAFGEILSYDVFKDLVPVALVTSSPHYLFVHPTVPVNTPAEIIAHLKANPGKLAYGSSGIGTNPHLSTLLFLQNNGLTALHVPYKGSAPMMIDVLAGRVQFGMTSVTSVAPQVREGRLKAVAGGGLTRSSLLPDVPTLAETVMPGFEVGNWFGVQAPAKTAPGIVNGLSRELVRALQDPDVRSKLMQSGIEPLGSSPEQFGAYLRSEFERWSKVIKTAGVKPE